MKRIYYPDPRRIEVSPAAIESAVIANSTLYRSRKNKAVDMWGKGYSLSDIAKEVGVDERQARQWTLSIRRADARALREQNKLRKAIRLKS